jgi:hypothetical protein
LFTVKAGDATVGGCDAHLQDLKISWEETCKEARQALDDLSFIETQSNNGKGPDAVADPAGRNRWNRVYNTYLALFGSAFDDDGKRKSAFLGKVQGTFSRVQFTQNL